MEIVKCKISVKCDVDGCYNKADYQFIFDGETPQYGFCKSCVDKMKNSLTKLDGGNKNESK